MWFEIATHLHCSVRHLKKTITSKEFVQWKHYLLRKRNEPTVDQLYLAQIALETRRSFVKNPNNVQLNHFLIGPHRKQIKKETTSDSKSIWLTYLGVKK